MDSISDYDAGSLSSNPARSSHFVSDLVRWRKSRVRKNHLSPSHSVTSGLEREKRAVKMYVLLLALHENVCSSGCIETGARPPIGMATENVR